ncbi:hypothetical protein [Derxia gummosa]|uniref:Uncharacterized protein n=1 Tax=Derxia gummosa DSM 723 TaxID=1121388 RepID=A0A8B6X9U2_9BURK|nr:hypothetical protein [Derxia gummosa]
MATTTYKTLTETAKTPEGGELVLCEGTRKGSYNDACRGTVFQCECGATGCQQTHDHMCSGQGFSMSGKCYKCGTSNKFKALAIGAYVNQAEFWANYSEKAA